LAGLVSLKKLSIDGPGFTSAGLAHLGPMSQLEDLYIGAARDLDSAAFACLARVPSLRRLSLGGGSFCDADLAPLAALVNLEELSLSKNDNITGTFCDHLIGLPCLRHLSLGETDRQVTDDGLSSIVRLPALVELYVEGPFVDAGLRHIGAVKKLETLSITSPFATSQGVAVVSALPNLNCLHLDTPLLNDEVVESLVRCSALEAMHIHKSSILEFGLQQLRDGLPRCDVDDFELDRCDPEPADDQDAGRPRLDSRTPIKTLLAEASDFGLFNGTFDKIFALYRYWVDGSKYSPIERVILLVWQSETMINGGGFDYLFTQEFEGDPDFRMTAEAYRIAGIDRSYEAFQGAFRLFPGGIVPHDPEERSRLYQAANKSARAGFTRKFWHDDRVRKKKLAEFIRANAAHLGDLDATY
jgi:hypothetical protein